MAPLTQELQRRELETVYRALLAGDPRAARGLNRLTNRHYSISEWLHMLTPVCQHLRLDRHDD